MRGCEARLALPVVALASLMLGLGNRGPVAAQTAEGRFDRTLEVSGPVDLSVSTGSGSIRIAAGETGRVRIVGRIRASRWWRERNDDPSARIRALETNPPIEQQGTIIRVGDIRDSALREGLSVSYDITVPRDANVRSRSGSGEHTIDGVAGRVDARAGSGSLRLTNVSSGVDATTGSGEIVITSVSGDCDLRTGSGRVRVEGIRGGLTVRTGSGGIEARGEPTRDWRLRAASGSVTVGLPETTGFELRARTSSGGIESRHPVTLGTSSRREIQGTVRGGGVRVELLTASGDIRIE